MMGWLRTMFERQAALAVGVVVAVLNLATAFGLDLTAEQTAAINAVLVAVGALLTRHFVWAEDSVRDVQAKAYFKGLADNGTDVADESIDWRAGDDPR